ncbi:MAG: histidinol-phosphate transaminase, partial [Candidatus Methylomirabilales bacterium]
MSRDVKTLTELAQPQVLELVPYSPGRPMEEVERELGLDDVLKLASNENPLGPSPLALQAI